MKILHTADWHLGDQPGPSKDGFNARALDTEERVNLLMDDARREEPDLIVIAGDVFHASRTWSSRGLREVQFAATAIASLSEAAPVAVIRGTPNHDGDSHFAMLRSYFDDNPRVHIWTEPGMHLVQAGNGETLSVCALPGFDKGYWRANHPDVDREDESGALTQALTDMILGMKAMCDPELPSVLVGHYTIDGCNTESGQTMIFSQFEPSVTQRTLAAAAFDLSLFGHIHRPQQLENNAFYCGAVNALNFNDADQDRGYYIHELQGHTLVRSDFHSLHPRRFLTIRLDDAQVDSFNQTGEAPWTEDAKDAIVRVLYSCTDEHNKALNRARMEDVLYAAGAFWVQEVTPQQISITANREAMTGENSPEANLRAWLEERNTEPADIDAILPVARELISSVVDSKRSDKARGLFVPLEISVVNYRNYREETFDFSPIRFCTINGVNGAGKSSLFCDAIYDALYESPREGDLTGWICNDPNVKSGAIRFTFRVGERTWRVNRTRVKSGKATLNLAELVDGAWQDRSCEKMRDTQAEIERVVGMDGMTLRACALIMQDQYGLFLQADKESRMKILGDVLGLQVYEDMAGVAADRVTESNRELRTLQSRKADAQANMPDTAALNAELVKMNGQILANEESRKSAEDERSQVNLKLNALREAARQKEEAEKQLRGIDDDIADKNRALYAAREELSKARNVTSRADEIRSGAALYRASLARRDELRVKMLEKRELDLKLDGLCNRRDGAKQQADYLAGHREGTERDLRDIDARLARKEELRNAPAELEAVRAELADMDARASERSELDRKLREAEQDAENHRRNAASESALRRADYNQMKKQAELLQSCGCPDPDNATCRFLANAREAAEKLPGLNELYKRLDAEAEDAQRSCDANVADLRRQLDAIPPEDPDARAALRERERKLTSQCAELSLMDGLEASRGQKQAEIERTRAEEEKYAGEIAQHEKDIAQVRDELSAYATVSDDFNKANRDAESYKRYADEESSLAVMQEREALAQERISDAQRSVEELGRKREECRRRCDELAEQAAGEGELLSRFNDLIHTLDSLRDERDKLIGSKTSLRGSLEQAKQMQENIDALNVQIASSSRLAAQYETLKLAFSNNGIPHSIVRSVVPVLEATATNILGQMSGGRMSVELVTEKVLKSNSKKEVVTLDIIINDAATGRLPYLSRSGGERVKASLAIILALSEIKSADIGVQIGFLMLDEPPYLDSDGTQAYVDALEAIQRRYGSVKVMAITHDESFRARFPQSVDVTKDENGSHAVLN